MIKVERIGAYNDRPVDQASLTSDTGVQVDIMNYGVVVRDWRVPVGDALRSVVLGFESFDPYPEHSPHLGSLAGRVANRVGSGRFELDGHTYDLPVNEAPHHLHGGAEGLGFQVWDMEPDDDNNRVRFTHLSPDGAMGYPGTVRFEAIYSLSGNKLRLELTAQADQNTPISLVQHQYFNLGTSDHVLDHNVWIDAPSYTPSDETLLPTGEIASVEGTHFDFRTAKNLRDAEGNALDFDLNMVLDPSRDQSAPIARIVGPDRALTLKLWSDRPGVQLYNGVWTDIKHPGLGGRSYGKHSGICLEDQAFPNAVNQSNFPSIIYGPDRPYAHWCEIEIK